MSKDGGPARPFLGHSEEPRAHAIARLDGGYFAHVVAGCDVIASCDHKHRTRGAAKKCADAMLAELANGGEA